MRPIVYAVGGFTVASGFNTLLMLALDLKSMVPAWALATTCLVVVTIGLWCVDWRIRRTLITMVDEIIDVARHRDIPLVYHQACILKRAILIGKSLTHAAARIGELSRQLGLDTDLETSL